jgi:hypothetical protein
VVIGDTHFSFSSLSSLDASDIRIDLTRAHVSYYYYYLTVTGTATSCLCHGKLCIGTGRIDVCILKEKLKHSGECLPNTLIFKMCTLHVALGKCRAHGGDPASSHFTYRSGGKYRNAVHYLLLVFTIFKVLEGLIHWGNELKVSNCN